MVRSTGKAVKKVLFLNTSLGPANLDQLSQLYTCVKFLFATDKFQWGHHLAIVQSADNSSAQFFNWSAQ